MKLLPGILLLSAGACLLATGVARADYVPSPRQPPEPLREFRGAWVASVWNIDWPSRPGLPPERQRAELLEILDTAAELKMNGIVLQVRPEADALYRSDIEPWSAWLTGTMGTGPADGYDPLEFAVAQAHARGMELHAWFNPFRGRANAKVAASSNHITRQHPEYLLPTEGQIWLDPAIPAVRKRAIDVMADVARRYDVDAIHLDDYFYPYPKKVDGRMRIIFNDSRSYGAYQQGGGELPVGAWRQSHVDSFVQELYQTIHQTRNDVKVGISPFGIWKPGQPASIEADLDSVLHLAADARKWLQAGWVDYLSPQLYWEIGDRPHSFTTLSEWWGQQNTMGRHLWPGIASSRIRTGTGEGRTSGEIADQIALARQHTGTNFGPGHIHWSMSAIMENRDGLRERLKSSYSEVALPPASPWMGQARTPGVPSPRILPGAAAQETVIQFGTPAADQKWWSVQVQAVPAAPWQTIRILPAHATEFRVPGQPHGVAVRSVNRLGLLSPASAWTQN